MLSPMKSSSPLSSVLFWVLLILCNHLPSSSSFGLLPLSLHHHHPQQCPSVTSSTLLLAKQNKNNKNTPLPSTSTYLEQTTQGGYTVKQRLREEVESPFRKVRLLFFGSSVASALTASYFSFLNTIKALNGTYVDNSIPLDEALTSDAINIGAAILCGVLCYREYQVGQANLQRIAKGGQLASLQLLPASSKRRRQSMADYRRQSRVLICAGGTDYIHNLCRSLTCNELSDENILAQKLQETDVLVVPVLLEKSVTSVGNTQQAWEETPAPSENNNNNNSMMMMDLTKANDVLAFPVDPNSWFQYLQSEVDTARGQGFDVLETGITLTIKKNGRILRRATGLPPWGDLIQTMEVMDGSKFGMPGDSEKYGGR